MEAEDCLSPSAIHAQLTTVGLLATGLRHWVVIHHSRRNGRSSEAWGAVERLGVEVYGEASRLQLLQDLCGENEESFSKRSAGALQGSLKENLPPLQERTLCPHGRWQADGSYASVLLLFVQEIQRLRAAGPGRRVTPKSPELYLSAEPILPTGVGHRYSHLVKLDWE